MLNFLYYFIYKNYRLADKVIPFIKTDLLQLKKLFFETNFRLLLISFIKSNLLNSDIFIYTDADESEDDFAYDFEENEIEVNEGYLSDRSGIFLSLTPLKLFNKLRLRKFLKKKRLFMKRINP